MLVTVCREYALIIIEIKTQTLNQTTIIYMYQQSKNKIKKMLTKITSNLRICAVKANILPQYRVFVYRLFCYMFLCSDNHMVEWLLCQMHYFLEIKLTKEDMRAFYQTDW